MAEQNEVEYGGIIGSAIDAPVSLTIPAGKARNIKKFLEKKEANMLGIEEAAWSLWAVLDDLFPDE